MAPVPYSANARLTLTYQVLGLVHRKDYPVDFAMVGGVPKLHSRILGTYSVAPSAMAGQVWGFAKAFYDVAVPAPTWTLFERVGTTFIPVASGPTAGGPGTGGTTVLASQLSITFKDSSNQRYNDYWGDTSWTTPSKAKVAGINATIDGYVDDVLLQVGGSIGDSLVSRGDLQVTRWIAWTLDSNRRVRRARHIA